MKKFKTAPCIIHLVYDEHFLPFCCDAHTHGLDKFGHLEFQCVLYMPSDIISHLLTGLAVEVTKGKKFKDGDIVDNIYADCYVKLVEMKDFYGNPILRVIVPDTDGNFPEDYNCDSHYNKQYLELKELMNA